jgi:hypothetical protein
MAAADRAPWRAVDGGLEVTLQVQPGAKADAIEGCVDTGDGGTALKVRLKAPPADGKANAALVKLLAKRWGVAKSDVALLQGAAGRRKRLRLGGDPAVLAARLRREL